MKTPMSDIFRAELLKMMKRKDLLSLLAVLGISILFSASILTDSYTGAKQQSALYWVVTQMLNSSILFISPMILAYSAVRTMAQEIENGSIKLFDQRIRDRDKLYAAKSLALICYSTILFAACLISHLIIYYLLACKSEVYASGKLFGENTLLLFCVLLALYLSTYVLIPQIALLIGTFAGQGFSIGLLFLVILAAHNCFKMPVAGALDPWRYIIILADDVLNTTAPVDMPGSFMLQNVLIQFGLCGFLCIASSCCGRHIFRIKDLP